MRVAVFRALDDGRRTAARLAELGHAAVLAPVVRIVPTGATVRSEDAEGIVFTSAQAPAALASHPGGLGELRDMPCWCVGERTAEAARATGFTQVRVGGGTATALAEAILADPGTRRLAFVAGRDRKAELERTLAQAGLRLSVVEAYQAQAVPSWSAGVALRLAGVTAALHYSSRSAVLARRLAEAAGLGGHFRAWLHVCLSSDIAESLGRDGASTVSVAEKPDEVQLLARLNSAGPS